MKKVFGAEIDSLNVVWKDGLEDGLFVLLEKEKKESISPLMKEFHVNFPKYTNTFLSNYRDYL